MSLFELISSEPGGGGSAFHGLAVGVVTNIDDPDKLGRVKVKLLNRDSSDFETEFIRVMTPMGGAQWGMWFFPEVGDEVIVGFGDGDIYRPYVLGTLWNKNKKPPQPIKDSKNDLRMIKTRSGHTLVFGDEDDKQFVELFTQGELKLRMDDKDNKITFGDKGGDNVVIIDNKNGEITIKAAKKINIVSGNSKVTIDGNGNQVAIESSNAANVKSQQITIESKGPLNVKSAATLNLSSDGPANLKGAMVKIN